jgi:outer membrane protein assembly factor BamB
VYFGSNDCHIYALYPDGVLKWRYEADTWVESSPTIGMDGTVYVGSTGGRFFAFNGIAPLGNTCWPKWHHDWSNTGRSGGH